jgi:catechol 2,3-dioxygenase-like lactoylglutathione lyase family enzyme
MRLVDINHVAIRTLELEKTNRFYSEILGMTFAYRPDLGFPGSWLQMGSSMIHVVTGECALDQDGKFTPGSAAVDHISIAAEGFDAYVDVFAQNGLDWRENAVPDAHIWQLMVRDPNGILIELNFDQRKEPANSRGLCGTRQLVLGKF